MASKFRTLGRVQIRFFAFQDIITSVTGILILVTLMLSFYLNPGPPARVDAVPAQTSSTVTKDMLDALQASNRVLQARLTEAASAPGASQLEQQQRALRVQEARISARVDALKDPRDGVQELLSSNLALQGVSAVLNNQLIRAKQALEAEQVQTNAVYVIRGSRQTQKKPVMVQISNSEIVIERVQGASPDTRVIPAGLNAAADFRAAIQSYQRSDEYFVFLVKPSGISLFRECLALARAAQFQFGYEPLVEEATVSRSPNASP